MRKRWRVRASLRLSVPFENETSEACPKKNDDTSIEEEEVEQEHIDRSAMTMHPNLGTIGIHGRISLGGERKPIRIDPCDNEQSCPE